MSDLSLIDIVNLIRAEIARTEIGNVKRITGPAGEQGPQGEAGIQGPQGPRGNDGKPGPIGPKGNQGKKGDKGVKGDDGADGVGIARVEQDIDNNIVIYTTDGEFYVVEMPLIQDDGSLAKEVHFKTGGGGSGDIDLSMYVRRPGTDLRDGRWLAYRETDNGATKEWSPITTDMVETNGQLMFRDSLGRFQPTPEELDELNNQLKVNRFIWDKIQELDLKAGGVAINDQPPADPDNGMFWFDNSEDVMQLYIWHTESDAWIPVAPPTTLEGRVAAGETTQAAIIEQIQESLVEQQQIKNKVAALEGAVGEHSFVFDSISQNPRAGEFILKDAGNRNTNYLSEGGIIAFSETDREDFPVDWSKINTGDVIRISSVDKQIGELRIVAKAATSAFIYEYLGGDLDRLSELPYDCLLMSAFDPAGLAQIDYVDARDKTKIGRRAIWTLENDTPWILRQNNLADQQRQFIKIHDGTMNLENVATPGDDGDAVNKAYVDQEIAKAIANIKAPEPEPRPAQFSWKYAGTTNGAHPPQYYFYTQGDDVLLSLISNNGLKITSDVEKSWRAAGDGAFEMSFWIHKGGNEWKLFKHCEIEKVYWQDKDNWNTNCLRFQKKWENNKNSFTSQHEYWITVGGFF